MSFRIAEIRRDGTRLPLGADYGRQDAAARAARLRAVTNSDPEVVEYDVTDAAGEIVFSAPASLVPPPPGAAPMPEGGA